MKINDVRRVLGHPYYQHGNVILYHTDGLRAMRELPHRTFDAMITSPPSRIDDTGEQGMPLSRYISWSSAWMQEAYHLLKRTGSFWLGLGCTSVKSIGRQVPLPYLLWNRSDFYFMQEFTGEHYHGARTVQATLDKFLWFVKDGKCFYVRPQARIGSTRLRAQDHPNSRQSNLSPDAMKRVLWATTRPGDIILDPFVCSQTTIMVAERLHRKIVGFSTDSSNLDRLAHWPRHK